MRDKPNDRSVEHGRHDKNGQLAEIHTMTEKEIFEKMIKMDAGV